MIAHGQKSADQVVAKSKARRDLVELVPVLRNKSLRRRINELPTNV
jgi:hypothetical protein